MNKAELIDAMAENAGLSKADAKKALEILLQVKEALLAGRSARTVKIEEKDLEHIDDLQLLTLKPVMYVCNVDEAAILKGNAYVDKVKEAVKDEVLDDTAEQPEQEEVQPTKEQWLDRLKHRDA